MAKFELNIYGRDDEIVAKYATDKVRWGVFLQALELQESLGTKSPAEQISVINDFVKNVFPDLTDADLMSADMQDVFNIFKQVRNQAQLIGDKSKNGVGEA